MKFDVEKTKKTFEGFMLPFLENAVHDPVKPMGNIAASDVSFILLGIFLGYKDEVIEYLPSRIECVEAAILGREDFGPNVNFHMAGLNRALGLGRWVLNQPEGEAWQNAANELEQCNSVAAGAFSASALKAAYLDEYCCYKYLAGDSTGVIKELETIRGKEGGAKAWAKVRALRDFCYLISKHVPEDFNSVEVAGKRVLNIGLADQWLSMGRYQLAALALKTIYHVVSPQMNASDVLSKIHEQELG